MCEGLSVRNGHPTDPLAVEYKSRLKSKSNRFVKEKELSELLAELSNTVQIAGRRSTQDGFVFYACQVRNLQHGTPAFESPGHVNRARFVLNGLLGVENLQV